MPSRSELAASFRTSENTVRKALSILSERRYISMHRGSSPVVCFDPSDPACLERLNLIFDRRRAAVADILDSYRFVLPPCIYLGISKLDQAEYTELYNTVRSVTGGDLISFEQASLRIMDFCLQKLDNNTALHYYNSTRLYLRVTLCGALYDGELRCGLLETGRKLFQWLAKCLQSSLSSGQPLSRREILAGSVWYLRRVAQELSLERLDPEQPAAASIFYENKPKYMRVCFSLIEEIFAGRYRAGDFLPSDAAAAAEYRVAALTARKAFKILNRMGFAKTIPQVGTQVIFRAQELKATPQRESDSARILEFLDCLRFFSMCIRSMALRACQRPEALEADLVSLEKRCAGSPPVFQIYCLTRLLECLVRHAGSVVLHSYFTINESLLFFGIFPLYDWDPADNKPLSEIIHRALVHLRAGEHALFASVFSAITERLVQEVEKFYFCSEAAVHCRLFPISPNDAEPEPE